MKIPSVTAYNYNISTKRQNNNTVTNTLNTPINNVKHQSFGILTDGVENDELPYDLGSFKKHLDFAISIKRISERDKRVILKAMELAKDDVNKILTENGRKTKAQLLVTKQPVLYTPSWLLPDPIPIWSKKCIGYYVLCPNPGLKDYNNFIDLKKEVQNKKKTEDEAARDTADKMIEFTRKSIDGIPLGLEFYREFTNYGRYDEDDDPRNSEYDGYDNID